MKQGHPPTGRGGTRACPYTRAPTQGPRQGSGTPKLTLYTVLRNAELLRPPVRLRFQALQQARADRALVRRSGGPLGRVTDHHPALPPLSRHHQSLNVFVRGRLRHQLQSPALTRGGGLRRRPPRCCTVPASAIASSGLPGGLARTCGAATRSLCRPRSLVHALSHQLLVVGPSPLHFFLCGHEILRAGTSVGAGAAGGQRQPTPALLAQCCEGAPPPRG